MFSAGVHAENIYKWRRQMWVCRYELNYEKYTHIPVSANAMFIYYSQKHHSDGSLSIKYNRTRHHHIHFFMYNDNHRWPSCAETRIMGDNGGITTLKKSQLVDMLFTVLENRNLSKCRCLPMFLNSLWSSDTIWRRKVRFTLVFIIACCRPRSHYLNQWEL